MNVQLPHQELSLEFAIQSEAAKELHKVDLENQTAMTIRAKTFTPEVLLSAPRRSAGTPNADGSLVLYSISTYSFETHESQSEIRLLDVTSNQSKVLTKTKGASEATWLNDGNVLLLLPGEKGKTRVVIGNTDDWDSR